ncbi:MAG: N-acetyltransferase [Desulfuromonas sp.]|nr:MAG: N-acetyltransferase [Desulfuromonas sp.]
MDIEIIRNETANRFEAEIDGFLAVIEYKIDGQTMALVHTGVPEELGGRGLGSKLVKFALDFARANELKVDPVCPFVKSYLERHPDYADLVAG